MWYDDRKVCIYTKWWWSIIKVIIDVKRFYFVVDITTNLGEVSFDFIVVTLSQR